MKTKSIFALIFWLITLSTQSQLFQNNYGHYNYYFHDVSVDQFHYNSQNLIFGGNIFDGTFSNPLTELVRIDDVTGNIIWQNTYNDPQGICENVRVFDITAYVGENGMDLLAITGSVTISNSNYIFVAIINENGDVERAAYYENVVDGATHTQGLNIIHTLNGPAGRAFVVGGFSNMDYDHSTSDMHRGFVMYIEEQSLAPHWTINIISTNPLSAYQYDMVSDVTETDQGFFITGSIGTSDTSFLQQAVLCLEVDFNGNTRWMKSYLFGNSRDVGVDAYYDQSSNEIYLLANYSISHFFGVTVLNNNTGDVNSSRSWYAYDWNNLNRYGFKIVESANYNVSSLVIAGYFRDGDYLDEYGNLVQSRTLPFTYEFDKSNGDQVSANYFYHIPYQDPGFSDYFDFWNAQMPLIYYPEMALKLYDEHGYFIGGYREDPIESITNIELIKTDRAHLNKCDRTLLEIFHDTISIEPVECLTEPSGPAFVNFQLSPLPYEYHYELSCTSLAIPGMIDEAGIQISPNPAEACLYIKLPENNFAHYTLYNTRGLRTAEGDLKGGEAVIDISTQSPGLYIVRLLLNNEYVTRKIIIE